MQICPNDCEDTGLQDLVSCRSSKAYSGTLPSKMAEIFLNDVQYQTHEISEQTDPSLSAIKTADAMSKALTSQNAENKASWTFSVTAKVPGLENLEIPDLADDSMGCTAENCQTEEFSRQEAALKLLNLYESCRHTIFKEGESIC